jgi:hypothetical protein
MGVFPYRATFSKWEKGLSRTSYPPLPIAGFDATRGGFESLAAGEESALASITPQ